MVWPLNIICVQMQLLMVAVLQLSDLLAEHRKQLKASQKTTLDGLQQEHDISIENTKQCYRAEVMLIKHLYKEVFMW